MSSEDQLILGISLLDSNDTTGDIRRDASKTVLLTTQLAFATTIGTICFLLFCFLRARWNVMYAPRSRLSRLAPEPLPDTFFGWIVPLLKIPERKVLTSVGLDATVLLAFLRMCYKLFAFCGFFALIILSPIKLKIYKYLLGLGKDDVNNLFDDPTDPTDPTNPDNPHESSELLVSYVVFTWVFSLATYYFTFYNYREFSEVRHHYYLKWKDTIAARSVMVTVIPKHLQTDRELGEFYNSLDLGEVKNATVYRHVRKLRHAIEQRANCLRKLEKAYAEYLGNPCDDPNYDPEEAFRVFEKALEEDPSTANAKTAAVLEKVNAKRPTMGSFLGLFGKKVDKIGYYTDCFIYYDQLVRRGRIGAYVSTSTGFVTFKDITSAQLAAQVLLYPEPFQCSTEIAPEPRDVYWYKLNIRKREMIARDVMVNCFVALIVFSWTVPTSAVASLLSLNSLKKIFPWLEKLAESNEILKGFIQGTLPTLAIVTLNAIIPQSMEFFSKLQGFKSRSAIESSTFSKYFFFLLTTILLIFTVVGTWLSALEDIAQNPTGITITLAKNLPRVAPFFINYIVLQGIGLYPSRILMIKDVIMTCLLRGFIANTPRDFAESSTPPVIDYGQELPPVVLIFVLVLVYSSLTPIILLFGTIYFFFGYVCYKYMLLFVYFHPYESAGLLWPKIFRGIIVGLIIFQLLMIGYMSLRKSFYLSVSIVPLLVITAIYYYYVNEAYDRSSEFVPLNLLRKGQNKVHTSTSDVNIKPKSSDTAEETAANTPSTNNENDKKRHSQRDVLDDDLYNAAPDLYSDYSQPPMTLYNGVLNTGMRDYAPPELKGSLPWLWLPVKRTKQDIKKGGFIRKLLGMNEKAKQSFSPSQSGPAVGFTIDSNKKVAAAKTSLLERAGSSSSPSGQSTSYGSVNISEPLSEQLVLEPEQVVTLDEAQNTSALDQLSKSQKRKSIADKLGEFAGSNFS